MTNDFENIEEAIYVMKSFLRNVGNLELTEELTIQRTKLLQLFKDQSFEKLVEKSYEQKLRLSGAQNIVPETPIYDESVIILNTYATYKGWLERKEKGKFVKHFALINQYNKLLYLYKDMEANEPLERIRLEEAEFIRNADDIDGIFELKYHKKSGDKSWYYMKFKAPVKIHFWKYYTHSLSEQLVNNFGN